MLKQIMSAGNGNRNNIYTSYPSKEEVEAKLEKTVVSVTPTMKVSAHAEYRFSLNITQESTGHSRAVDNRNKGLIYYGSNNLYTYDLQLNFKITYTINHKEYEFNDYLEVYQSNNLLNLKEFIRETPKERYEKIMTDLLKREIPYKLENEEKEAFLEEIKNMESIVIDFSFEVEDKKSC